MGVDTPTVRQLGEVAERLGFHMSGSDLESFIRLMGGAIAAYNLLDSIPDNLPQVRYPRGPGYKPAGEENKYGAWYWKTSVQGASSGKLRGKKIVVKDTVCLAGVPMSGGASVLEGYVPDVDATIVTRILDAGGEIVGKAVCEYFSVSGGSHTSATGPVHNPRRMGYSAGGSSSGSAALVAAGEVDMAIGGDQGGSIRIPSAFCGTYGMKPTYGLVPYTGIMSIDTTLDHTGPITANVADNALLLEVLAGPDGIDPRQVMAANSNYCDALGQGVSGVRIAMVREGFDALNSEPQVNARVRAAAQQLAKLGATVEEVSVPMHPVGQAIFAAIASEGCTDLMMKGNGFATNHKGLYIPSLQRYTAGWRERADEFADTLKLFMLTGQYMQDKYQGVYYGKAQNLARRLAVGYNEVLSKYDLLLMPTLPIVATPLPGPNASREEIVQRALEMLANTPQFDMTGHPAMSVPCGTVDGLPVGMMLVGRHLEERTIYRAAHGFEQSCDWQRL
jgi:amidase